MPGDVRQSFDANSGAVTAHLSIVQGTIGRMAGSSTSCKIQCVVLVTGIIVLTAQTDTTAYVLIGLLPTVLFLFLDAYYLALEQGFRQSYDAFVSKLHSGQTCVNDLFVVRPARPAGAQMLVSMRSTAVWPFYLMLAIAVALVWKFDCVKALLGF